MAALGGDVERGGGRGPDLVDKTSDCFQNVFFSMDVAIHTACSTLLSPARPIGADLL